MRAWAYRRSLCRRRLGFLEHPVALVLPERAGIARAPVPGRQVEESFAGKPVGARNHQGAEHAEAVSDAALAGLAQQLCHSWRPPVDRDAATPQALAELSVDQALAASGNRQQYGRRNFDLVLARGWLVDGLDAERLADPSQVGCDALQRVGRAVQLSSQGRLADARDGKVRVANLLGQVVGQIDGEVHGSSAWFYKYNDIALIERPLSRPNAIRLAGVATANSLVSAVKSGRTDA